MSNEIFTENLKNGSYDSEITKVLLDWQVDNANKRIEDYINYLEGKYDGERLSISGLNQNYIDELLHLGRELHNETRRSYLKANLEQYLHDLKYIKEPSIYITDAEWDTIHAGNIHQLEVLRNWASEKLESLKVESDTPVATEGSESTEEAPAKRTRKAKNTEEK